MLLLLAWVLVAVDVVKSSDVRVSVRRHFLSLVAARDLVARSSATIRLAESHPWRVAFTHLAFYRR
jgi:hypothetical protein